MASLPITGDMDGQVLAMQDCSDVTASDVKRQLSKFLGKIKQVPPNFSALHVDGRRLHNLARKGLQWMCLLEMFGDT